MAIKEENDLQFGVYNIFDVKILQYNLLLKYYKIKVRLNTFHSFYFQNINLMLKKKHKLTLRFFLSLYLCLLDIFH